MESLSAPLDDPARFLWIPAESEARFQLNRNRGSDGARGSPISVLLTNHKVFRLATQWQLCLHLCHIICGWLLMNVSVRVGCIPSVQQLESTGKDTCRCFSILTLACNFNGSSANTDNSEYSYCALSTIFFDFYYKSASSSLYYLFLSLVILRLMCYKMLIKIDTHCKLLLLYFNYHIYF